MARSITFSKTLNIDGSIRDRAKTIDEEEILSTSPAQPGVTQVTLKNGETFYIEGSESSKIMNQGLLFG